MKCQGENDLRNNLSCIFVVQQSTRCTAHVSWTTFILPVLTLSVFFPAITHFIFLIFKNFHDCQTLKKSSHFSSQQLHTHCKITVLVTSFHSDTTTNRAQYTANLINKIFYKSNSIKWIQVSMFTTSTKKRVLVTLTDSLQTQQSIATMH